MSTEKPKFWKKKEDKKDDKSKKKEHKEVDETKLLAALDSVGVNEEEKLRSIGLGLLESLPEYGCPAGTTVAAISDPTYPFEGVKGKVKGPSAKGSGFVDVEYPSGVVVAMQSSLLIPV